MNSAAPFEIGRYRAHDGRNRAGGQHAEFVRASG
jgi:hypothetical protein